MESWAAWFRLCGCQDKCEATQCVPSGPVRVLGSWTAKAPLKNKKYDDCTEVKMIRKYVLAINIDR